MAKLKGAKKAEFLRRMAAGRRKAARKNTGRRKKTSVHKKARRARGTLANPAKGRIGKKGTGWLSAKAVKIVRRRGKPDQVLVRR